MGLQTWLAKQLSKGATPTELNRDDWMTLKGHLEAASKHLLDARKALRDAADPKPDDEFSRELSLLTDVTLDVRRQVVLLGLRADDHIPSPGNETDGYGVPSPPARSPTAVQESSGSSRDPGAGHNQDS
jgi:hypothetical protein